MNTENRQIKIFEYLKAHGSVSVNTLASIFNVSDMTIRRDLSALENASLIVKRYGKAEILTKNELDIVFPERAKKNTSLKHKVAQLTLPLIKHASSIYVDCSSTAFELLECLPQDQEMTVFTNSLAALNVLVRNPKLSLFAIGGFLCNDHNTLDDETSIETAKQIFVDVALISCVGFSYEGLFNNAYRGTQIKRIISKNADKCILLADHTKAFQRGIFLLNEWEAISYLVTDEPPEATLYSSISQRGVKIIYEHNQAF